MTPEQSTGRREFVKGLLLFPLAILLGRQKSVFAAGDDIGKKLVKGTDPMPSALKYVDDAKKAPAAMRKDAQSSCQNCAQYTKKATYKGQEVGMCNLFNGGYVKANGWCMSWSKKG